VLYTECVRSVHGGFRRTRLAGVAAFWARRCGISPMVRSEASVTFWLGRKTDGFSLGPCGIGLASDASVDDRTGKGW
jgi:hypothetical protein